MRKLTFALLAGALAIFLPVAAAEAQTYNDVSAGVTAGGFASVTLGPFDPFSTVRGTLNSDPVNLGTAQANAQGFATFKFQVPANFSGSHSVTASGVLNGQPKTVTSPAFTVKPASAVLGSTQGLARTGSDNNTVPMAVGGAAAIAAGAGLVVVAKRRRSAAPVAA